MTSRQSRIDHNSRKASIQSYETTLYSEGLDDGAEEPMQISPGSFDRPDVPHMLMSPPPEEILRSARGKHASEARPSTTQSTHRDFAPSQSPRKPHLAKRKRPQISLTGQSESVAVDDTEFSASGSRTMAETTPNPKARKQSRQNASFVFGTTPVHSPTKSRASASPSKRGLKSPHASNPNADYIPALQSALKEHVSPRRHSVAPIPPYEPPPDRFTPPREVIYTPLPSISKSSKRKSLPRGSTVKASGKGKRLTLQIKKEPPEIDLNAPLPPASPSDDPLLLVGPPRSHRKPKRRSTQTAIYSRDTPPISSSPMSTSGEGTRLMDTNFTSLEFDTDDDDNGPLPAIFNFDFDNAGADNWSDDGPTSDFDQTGEYTGKFKSLLVPTKVDPPSSCTKARQDAWGHPISPFPLRNQPSPIPESPETRQDLQDSTFSSDDGTHLSQDQVVQTGSPTPRSAPRIASPILPSTPEDRLEERSTSVPYPEVLPPSSPPRESEDHMLETNPFAWREPLSVASDDQHNEDIREDDEDMVSVNTGLGSDLPAAEYEDDILEYPPETPFSESRVTLDETSTGSIYHDTPIEDAMDIVPSQDEDGMEVDVATPVQSTDAWPPLSALAGDRDQVAVLSVTDAEHALSESTSSPSEKEEPAAGGTDRDRDRDQGPVDPFEVADDQENDEQHEALVVQIDEQRPSSPEDPYVPEEQPTPEDIEELEDSESVIRELSHEPDFRDDEDDGEEELTLQLPVANTAQMIPVSSPHNPFRVYTPLPHVGGRPGTVGSGPLPAVPEGSSPHTVSHRGPPRPWPPTPVETTVDVAPPTARVMDAGEDDFDLADEDPSIIKIVSADPKAAARAAAILKLHKYDCLDNSMSTFVSQHRESDSLLKSVLKSARRKSLSSSGVQKLSARRRQTLGGVIGNKVIIPGSPVTTLPELLEEAEASLILEEDSFHSPYKVAATSVQPKTPARDLSTPATRPSISQQVVANRSGPREWTKADWKLLDSCYTDERLALCGGSRVMAPAELVDLHKVVDRFVDFFGGDEVIKTMGSSWTRDDLLKRARALRRKQGSGKIAPPSRSPSSMSVDSWTPSQQYTTLMSPNASILSGLSISRPRAVTYGKGDYSSVSQQPVRYAELMEEVHDVTNESLESSELSAADMSSATENAVEKEADTSHITPLLPGPASLSFASRVKGLIFSYLPRPIRNAPQKPTTAPSAPHIRLPVPPPEVFQKPRPPITTPAPKQPPKPPHPKDLVQLHPAPSKPSMIPRPTQRQKLHRWVELHPVPPRQSTSASTRSIDIPRDRRDSSASVKDLVKSFQELENAQAAERQSLKRLESRRAKSVQEWTKTNAPKPLPVWR